MGIYIGYYHIPWEEGYSWHTQLLSEAYRSCLGLWCGADCPLGVCLWRHLIGSLGPAHLWLGPGGALTISESD